MGGGGRGWGRQFLPRSFQPSIQVFYAHISTTPTTVVSIRLSTAPFLVSSRYASSSPHRADPAVSFPRVLPVLGELFRFPLGQRKHAKAEDKANKERERE